MRKLKEWGFKIIISIAFGGLLYLSRYEIWLTILSYVISSLLIEYFWKNKITYNKLKLKLNLADNFNEEYYDLYWDFNTNRLSGFFNTFVFGLALSSLINHVVKLDLDQSIAISSVVIFVVITVFAIVIGSSKRENILMHLFYKRKQNWIGEYTEEESAILKDFVEL